MSVLTFPDRMQASRCPRLVTDEQLLKNWYGALEWEQQDAWYTLHELRAATRIPMARLPIVLYRLGWIAERKRGYNLTFWHGPNSSDPLEGP